MIFVTNAAGYGVSVLIGGHRDASVPVNEWREASLNDTSADQLPQGKGFQFCLQSRLGNRVSGLRSATQDRWIQRPI